MELPGVLQPFLISPGEALALAGLALLLAALSYVLADAVAYRRIPELSVPLTAGGAAARRVGACAACCRR